MTNFKEILIKIKDVLVNFFKTRRVGFYLLMLCAILASLVTIIYTAAFLGSERYGAGAALFPLLTIVCLLLTIYKPVERYASITMNIVCIFALLFFLNASYWHFGDSFFAVKDNMPTDPIVILNMLGAPYSYCLIALVLNVLITFACIFIPVSKKEGGKN